MNQFIDANIVKTKIFNKMKYDFKADLYGMERFCNLFLLLALLHTRLTLSVPKYLATLLVQEGGNV